MSVAWENVGGRGGSRLIEILKGVFLGFKGGGGTVGAKLKPKLYLILGTKMQNLLH